MMWRVLSHLRKWKKRDKGTLRGEILGPLVAAIIILIVAFGISLYGIQRHEIDEASIKACNHAFKVFQMELGAESRATDVMANVIADNKQVLEAFFAEDKKTLRRLCENSFEHWGGEQGIYSLTFLRSDLTTFLKMGTPGSEEREVGQTNLPVEFKGQLSYDANLK